MVGLRPYQPSYQTYLFLTITVRVLVAIQDEHWGQQTEPTSALCLNESHWKCEASPIYALSRVIFQGSHPGYSLCLGYGLSFQTTFVVYLIIPHILNSFEQDRRGYMCQDFGA